MLAFPPTPTPGEIYQRWQWDGTKWVAAPPPPATAYLPLHGGTMTGAIVQPLPPATPAEVPNRLYVDESIATQALYQGVWRPDTNVPDLSLAANQRDGFTYMIVTPDPTLPFTVTVPVPGLTGQVVNNGDRAIWSVAASAWQVVPGGGLTMTQGDLRYLQLIGGTLAGPGNLTVEGDLTVDGEVDFTSTTSLHVAGTSTFDRAATFKDEVTVDADLVTGTVFGLGGTVTVNDPTEIHGDLTIDGRIINNVLPALVPQVITVAGAGSTEMQPRMIELPINLNTTSIDVLDLRSSDFIRIYYALRLMLTFDGKPRRKQVIIKLNGLWQPVLCGDPLSNISAYPNFNRTWGTAVGFYENGLPITVTVNRWVTRDADFEVDDPMGSGSAVNALELTLKNWINQAKFRSYPPATSIPHQMRAIIGARNDSEYRDFLRRAWRMGTIKDTRGPSPANFSANLGVGRALQAGFIRLTMEYYEPTYKLAMFEIFKPARYSS